jgi:hypothetical protein
VEAEQSGAGYDIPVLALVCCDISVAVANAAEVGYQLLFSVFISVWSFGAERLSLSVDQMLSYVRFIKFYCPVGRFLVMGRCDCTQIFAPVDSSHPDAVSGPRVPALCRAASPGCVGLEEA